MTAIGDCTAFVLIPINSMFGWINRFLSMSDSYCLIY